MPFHATRHFPVLHFIACALAVVCGGCDKHEAPKVAAKPTKLPVISAAAAGLDPERLHAFAEGVAGDGVVVRHGAVAFTWGTPEKSLDIGSASKAFYSFLVLKAVEEGRIPSLDQPVVQWLPELGTLNAALDHKDARITWRHLINQTSCYGVSEAPGSAFDYNDYQTGLLWILLFEKVYKTSGEAALKILNQELFQPIGVKNGPGFRLLDPEHRLCRLVISPLDMARFGLVFLHDGKWGDKQIISPEHVSLVRNSPLPLTLPRTAGKDAEMLPGAPSYGAGKDQDDHLGCYSQMWWLNKRDRKGELCFPSAPEDAFAAIGFGGQTVLMVVPSLDLIVCWNTKSIFRGPLVGTGHLQIDALLKPMFSAVKQGS